MRADHQQFAEDAAQALLEFGRGFVRGMFTDAVAWAIYPDDEKKNLRALVRALEQTDVKIASLNNEYLVDFASLEELAVALLAREKVGAGTPEQRAVFGAILPERLVLDPEIQNALDRWERVKTGDYSRLDLALVGNALKVGMYFGMAGDDRESHVPGRFLDAVAKRAFGRNVDAFAYERDSVVFSEMLDRLSGQVIGQWREYPFTEVSVTFIPEPGYPWPVDEHDEPDFRYYSAARGKWIEPKKPGWLIEIRDDDGETARGVNPCLVFPAEATKVDPAGPVCGHIGGRGDDIRVMVTHSMQLYDASYGENFHKSINVATESINACGGFLMPSLAVGPIPATNFGPLVLVAPLALALHGLKPYRGKKSETPSWVYPSDAWTRGTSWLMTAVARRLFRELHGHEDYMYGQQLEILGPPMIETGGPKDEGNVALETTKALRTALKRRMRPWRDDVSRAEFEKLNEHLDPDAKYAYCEAKAREVVLVDTFPYFIVPDSYLKEAEYFVKKVGYRGEIVVLHDVVGLRKTGATANHDFALYRWAWVVAETINKLRPVAEIAT